MDAVESMAYAKSGGVPWHGLGNPVHDKMTPAQMCKAAGIAWDVSKYPLYWKGKDGKYHAYPNQCALVRDSDKSPLSIVGVDWNEVQNLAIAEFLQKFCKAGHMNMETAGSLWNGRFIWCLARVNKDFDIGKGDKIQPYVLIMNPHQFGKAGVFQFTPVRVVCWNTLTYALGTNLKGVGNAFRLPHTKAFDDTTKKAAEEALGLAVKQVDEFREEMMFLSKKSVKEPEVEEYFCEVMQWDPKNKKHAGKDQTREPTMIPKFRQALTHAPGQQLPSAKGTWWGALQAVTYAVDHEVGKDPNTALKNIWLGNYAQVKREAVTIALKRAA